jgi:hypothetical protein
MLSQGVKKFLVLIGILGALPAPSCAAFKKDAGTIAADGQKIAIDCLDKAVSAQVPAVVGEINQILIDSSKSVDTKQFAIDQLQVASVAVLACAAREAFSDLTRSHMFDSANPEIITNRATIKGYLEKKSYRFADGYTVAVDADAGSN